MTTFFAAGWMFFHNNDPDGFGILIKLNGFIGMLAGIGIYLDSSYKVAKLEREIKPLEEELRKVEREIEELRKKCSKKLKKYSKKNKTDWEIFSALTPEIENALVALSKGDFTFFF